MVLSSQFNYLNGRQKKQLTFDSINSFLENKIDNDDDKQSLKLLFNNIAYNSIDLFCDINKGIIQINIKKCNHIFKCLLPCLFL
jgi:hypothetical protein